METETVKLRAERRDQIVYRKKKIRKKKNIYDVCYSVIRDLLKGRKCLEEMTTECYPHHPLHH